jgi:hypothetical protein
LISGRLEDVIVQKEPAVPVYCEHSFVTWSCLFRPEADTEAAPMLSARVRAIKPGTATNATMRRQWVFMGTPLVAAGLRRSAQSFSLPMRDARTREQLAHGHVERQNEAVSWTPSNARMPT